MVADTKFWNKLAERYARKPIANMDAYQRKLVATKERLRPDHVVLDIGCGTGSLALELAPSVAHVHALDYSSEMIRIGREKAARASIDNVTFHNTVLEDLPGFPPASFDVICAYNILHLVDDCDADLRRIATLLKPGGSFVSSTPCLGAAFSPVRLLLPIMRLFGKAPRVELLTHARLDASFRAAGFVDMQTPDVGAPPRTRFALLRTPVATVRADAPASAPAR